MGFFTVDAAKCKRDGICVADCPAFVLMMPETGGPPVVAPGGEARCIRCGHCVAVCPHGACAVAGISPEDCPPVREDLSLSREQADQFLRGRRSIRVYRDEAVPREALAELIGIARYAPTGTNSQQIRWIALPTRQAVARVAGHAIDWMEHAVETRAPLAEAYGFAPIIQAWEAGFDIITRGAPALVFATAPEGYLAGPTDCTIALSHLDLAAPTRGLGACWAGFVMIAAASWAPLREALGIAGGYALGGAMMVGYPKHKYYRLPPRREPRIDWREDLPE